MLFQPRKFKFKNKYKDRRFRVSRVNKLVYGLCGVRIKKHLWFTAKKASRLLLFLKRSSKRVDITNRFVWFNISPHFPASKKIKGARMGKGTGKLTCWFTLIKSGSTIIEFKNIRHGRAYYYMRLFSFKMSCDTVFLWSSNLILQTGRKSSWQTKISPVYFQ
jgi:ribosomal protein L16/L10AE